MEVPRSDGTLTSESLRATDYASLIRWGLEDSIEDRSRVRVARA